MQLRGAILFVKDLERMTTFYADMLAMKILPDSRTDSWVAFDAGFGLHAIPRHIAEDITITTPPQVREETPIKLIFAVTELSQEVTRLQAAGVPVTLKPWGAADGIDPEGNVFQLVSL